MRTTTDAYIEREKIYSKLNDLWNNNFVLNVSGRYGGTIDYVLNQDNHFRFDTKYQTIIIDKTEYELEKFENHILFAHKTNIEKNFSIKIFSLQPVNINQYF